PDSFGDIHTCGHRFNRRPVRPGARSAGGVRGYRAPEGSDVHDVVIDVDDVGDGANRAGASDDVGAGDEAAWVDCVVEDGAGQAGVVHGVQVDDQVELNRGAHWSVGERELEDLVVRRDGGHFGDSRRDAVADDLDAGPDFETFTLAAEQRQGELLTMTDQAVVDEETFHVDLDSTGGPGARIAGGAPTRARSALNGPGRRGRRRPRSGRSRRATGARRSAG